VPGFFLEGNQMPGSLRGFLRKAGFPRAIFFLTY
jgi:hypothetical protein